MNNKTIITLLEENELNVSSLYSLYSQKIPDKKEFWELLSNEEVAHAVSIGNKKIQEDGIIENKFSRGIIDYISNFVLEEIAKAQQQDEISHKDALLTALRVEQSMLEKKCFELFTPSDQLLIKLFHKLNGDTERHVAMILKEIKKNKFEFEELEK